MTVDSKTALKGRNTPSKRTSCTTFKKWRDSLVPGIKFIPVVDVTWAVFLSRFSFSSFFPPSSFENAEKQDDSICCACVKSLLRCSLTCTCPVEYRKCEDKYHVIVFSSVSHKFRRVPVFEDY